MNNDDDDDDDDDEDDGEDDDDDDEDDDDDDDDDDEDEDEDDDDDDGDDDDDDEDEDDDDDDDDGGGVGGGDGGGGGRGGGVPPPFRVKNNVISVSSPGILAKARRLQLADASFRDLNCIAGFYPFFEPTVGWLGASWGGHISPNTIVLLSKSASSLTSSYLCANPIFSRNSNPGVTWGHSVSYDHQSGTKPPGPWILPVPAPAVGNLPIRHSYRLNPPNLDRDNPRNNDPPTLRPENRPKKKQRIHAHVSAPTPATTTAPAVATVGDHPTEEPTTDESESKHRRRPTNPTSRNPPATVSNPSASASEWPRPSPSPERPSAPTRTREPASDHGVPPRSTVNHHLYDPGPTMKITS